MQQFHQRRGDRGSGSLGRGTESRKGRPRRPTLEALETRQLLSVSEFSEAVAAQKAFNLSDVNAARTQPMAITSEPNGNLWFADRLANLIGEINPANDQITFPPNQPAAGSAPSGITVGPDGNIWFTEAGGTGNSQIGMINVSTGALSQFGTSNGMSDNAGAFGIVKGPDNNLWFTEGIGKIGKIDPKTQKITEYSSGLASTSGPLRITVGPDNNLWFTELLASAIGKINPANPDAGITSYSTGMPANVQLGGITAGSDGQLWFALIPLGASRQTTIGSITTTGAITPHTITLPGISGQFGLVDVTSGSDDNVWFTAGGLKAKTAAIGSINPTTLAVTAVAPPGTSVQAITSGPDDNIWFTDNDYSFQTTGNQTLMGGAVGVVTLSTGGGNTGGGNTGGGNTGGGNTGGGNTGGGNTTGSSPAPTVISETLVSYRKKNRKGKSIGKPLAEVVLTFSTAMSTVGNAGAYQVFWDSIKRVKRKLTKIPHQVAVVAASPGAGNTTVTLMTTTPISKFSKGRQVTIVSPGSILSADGLALSGPNTFQF